MTSRRQYGRVGSLRRLGLCAGRGSVPPVRVGLATLIRARGLEVDQVELGSGQVRCCDAVADCCNGVHDVLS